MDFIINYDIKHRMGREGQGNTQYPFVSKALSSVGEILTHKLPITRELALDVLSRIEFHA